MTRSTFATRNRRALLLLAIAVFHVGWGVMVALDVRPPDRGAAVLYEWLPMSLRVWLWLSIAATVAVLAWTRWQSAAWALAILMPTERALGHLWSACMWLIPGAPPGSPLALGWLLVWSSIACVIYLASGIVEDRREVSGG